MNIIQSKPCKESPGLRPARVILVKLEDRVEPFVTWIQTTDESPACFWGHYFGTLDAALEDFNSRS